MPDYNSLAAQVGGTAEANNPYLDLLKQQDDLQKAQAATALSASVDVNADRAAQNRALAKRYNTAPEVVDKYPEDFRQRMATEVARQDMEKAPKLQAQINADPSVAKIVHDDTKNAAAIEQTVGNHLTASQRLDQFTHPFNNALVASPMLGVQTPFIAAGGLYQAISQLWGGSENNLGYDIANKLVDVLGQKGPEATDFAGKALNTTGSTLNALALAVPTGGLSVARGVAQLAPQAGAKVAEVLGIQTRHGIQAMTLPAAQASQETYKAVMEQTGDHTDALKAGIAAYVTNTLGGIVPFAKAGSPLLSRIGAGVAVGPTFGAFNRQVMNAALPDSMQSPVWGNAEDTSLEMLSGGVFGAMAGSHTADAASKHLADALVRAHREALLDRKAEQDFNAYTALGQLSAASKYRERDPEGFKQYIEKVTEDGNLKDVYVPRDVLREQMLKTGVDEAQLRELMPEVAEQLTNPVEDTAKADVRMSAADYAAHIAGGPMDDVLLQHMKTDPNGKTYAEVEAGYKDQADKMLSEAGKIADGSIEDGAFNQSKQAVVDKIHADLEAVGQHTSPQHRIMATVQGAILSRIAARENITPEEAHAKYGSSVVGGVHGASEGGLNQTLPSRMPSAKAGRNPSVHDVMLADLDTLKQDPKQLEQAVNAVAEEPGMKSKKRTTESKLEDMITKMTDNLLWLHDQIPEDIRARSKLWYDGARVIADKWSDKYNKTRMQTAGILAVLSPQKDWFMNVTMAERILDILHTKMDHKFDSKMRGTAFQFLLKDYQKPEEKRKNTAAFDKIKDMTLAEAVATGDNLAVGIWLRAYDEAHHSSNLAVIHPEGDFGENTKTEKGNDGERAWGGFDALGKAASIYIDGSPENVSEALGGEHKVRNFYNNIYEPNDPRFTTIDTHAVAAALLRPLAGSDKPVADNFGKTGGTEITGVSGSYPIYYEAYKRAAEARGILPREMQSITWEAVRGLFKDTFKTQQGKAADKDGMTPIDLLWKQVDDGKLTIEEARQQIHDMAEGINHPDWWDGQEQSIPVTRDKSYTQTRDAFVGRKITFEVAPNPDNAELSARWNALPVEKRAEISSDIAWNIAGKALAYYNSDTIKGELHLHVGGYGDDTNPSMSLWMNKYASMVKVQELAHLLGYALQQKSMMVTSPAKFKGGEEWGTVVVHGVDDAKAEALYDELRGNVLDADGAPLIGGHTTDSGNMVILVPKDSVVEVAEKVGAHLGDRHEVWDERLHVQWPEKGENDYGLHRNETGKTGGSGAESPLRAHADQLRIEASRQLEQRIAQEEQHGGFYQSADGAGSGRGERLRVGPEEVGARYGKQGDAGSVLGIHYSPERRDNLAGYFYGQGLKGAEAKRLAESDDPRLQQRIHFYVDEGNGIRPEAGVGGQVHGLHLDNLYSTKDDPLNLRSLAATDFNAFEKAVLDAGYDGVYVYGAQGDQGVAVLLGSHTARPDYLGTHSMAGAGAYVPPSRGLRSYSLMSKEMRQFEENQAAIQADAPSAEIKNGNLVFADADADAIAKHFPGAKNARELHQNDGITRGTYFPNGNPARALDPRSIELLKDANLSTYLHETGHWALDIYSKIALDPNASPEIKADMDVLLKDFGIKGDTPEERLANWHNMSLNEQRPHHEKLAESFETYLFEGKAPSEELRTAFANIKTWMLEVYKDIKNMVGLSDEVRGVFDRMLASEEEIKDLQAQRVFEMPFASKEEAVKAGVSEEDYNALLKAHQDGTQTAVEELTAKSLKDMKWLSGAKSRALKAAQKAADGLRDAIRKEVEIEVDQMPVYAAEKELKRKDGLKLSIKGLEDLFAGMGDRYALLDWKPLVDKRMASKTGDDPQIVAELLGYPDAKALVHALLTADAREEVVKGLTDKRMLEEHGDLATPAGIERAANEAIHNDARARFIATGLKVLTKAAVSARALVKGAREAADAAIGARKIKDINPRQHEAAETKANKDMLKLVAKDPAGAIQAQRASLLNNQLVKSAQQALTDVQKGLEYFKRLEKPSVLENIDVECREQIQQLLARYDLRKGLTPEAAMEKNIQSLEKFVEKLASMKFAIDVPEKMILDANRMHYKDMTVDEFRGLVAAIQSIEHLGREVQKITDGEESRYLADVAREAKLQTEKLPKHNPETNRGLSLISRKWLDAKSLGRSIQASLLKTEQICDWLDNHNPLGLFNRMVFRKIADAEGRRNDLDLAITKKWEEAVGKLPKDLFKNSRESVEMPGVIDGLTGKTQRLTWGEKIALAGIRGDMQHFNKLLKGEGWAPEAVLKFLDENMTKEEWAFVKSIADTFQELHPLKVAMMRDLGSTAPKAVEHHAFDTPHGQMPGWYWPITYDPARSHSVKERSAKHGASIFEDNIFTRADTSTGRENTRSESYARPMLLSIDVLPRVLKDEIRDITTRKAIIEADRFLSHPDVREAIESSLSPQHYDVFNGWLLSLANDAHIKPGELQMWDRIAHEIRTRTTMVGLGFRISTMIQHGATAAAESVAEAGFKPMAQGIFNKKSWAGVMKEIGPEWLTKGLAAFDHAHQFEANANFITDRSAEMRHRMNEYERDVREQLRAIDIQLMDPATSALTRAKLAIEARAYHGIAMLDMASAMPTWMGAYLKGMEKAERGGLGMTERDAVYFADKTVRNAHGGGGIKDMAMVQRGGEFMKLFTMFYTFWNHNINRIMDTGRRVKGLPDQYADARESGEWGKFRGDVGTLLLRSFMYTLGVQAIHHMLHPPEEEDESYVVWFAKQMALSITSGVPLARDVIGHFAGGKDFSLSPVVSMVQNTDALLHDFSGEATDDAKWIKHAMTEAGYVVGLPLGQVGATVQFLSDIWNGKQRPEDISAWWRGVMTGNSERH